ncbi:hypothetical protein MMC10_000565 [Thelotrema lepadinum]|nr:hypothetical protein [Thelotrema lepadinum]
MTGPEPSAIRILVRVHCPNLHKVDPASQQVKAPNQLSTRPNVHHVQAKHEKNDEKKFERYLFKAIAQVHKEFEKPLPKPMSNTQKNAAGLFSPDD